MKKSSPTAISRFIRTRIKTILEILHKEYPENHTALHHSSPFHLLVAVILSAQCTDARVNLVTPALFKRFSSVKEFATANVKELEQLIRSTGFYHNKARNIVACAKTLLENHHGVVPSTMEKLVELPGVGRKTANVVLGEAFNRVEGIVVDTHVLRLSNRLGFTQSSDAVRVEQDLIQLLPMNEWKFYSNALIFHGRKICAARKPLCHACVISKYCPSAKKS